MTKKDEAEALGNAMLKTVAAATREAAGEKLSGNAKVLNDLLDEVAGQQQRLTLRIYRKGFGVNAGSEEFIAPLYNIDPEMLRESGIEPTIQQYSGGGNYRIVITAPGVPMRSISCTIAGEPLPPKPERDLRAAAGGAPIPPGFPFPMTGAAGVGFNAGAPGAAQYLGIPGQFGQGQSQSHITDTMLLTQMILGMQQQMKPAASADSDEVKVMREQIAELKAQTARAEQEKLRIESEHRAEAQIIALQAQMEKLAAPKENLSEKFLALAGALGPVVVGYLQSREQAATQAAQAQAQAQQHQTNMIVALMGSQKDASKDSIDIIKTMMLQPKESETDRMRGIMDIAASSMSTTMGLSQAMINQIQAMQPGERPWWQDALMNVIESASQLGQAALESRSQKMAGGEEQEAQQIGPVEVRQMPDAVQPRGIEGAAAAAAAAAQESLSTPDGMVPEGDARVAGIEQPVEEEEMVLPDFSAGAFKIIFELISSEEGNVHEIAFRVWKHASSGNKDALAWVQNPEEYTFIVLDALAQRGKLLVTAERIHQIAAAMFELFDHFRGGLDAVEYVKKHSLSISLPKRLVIVPLPPREPGEVDYPEDEEDEAEGVQSNPTADTSALVEVMDQTETPAVVVPEPPKEPPVPTPTYGNGGPSK